VLYFVFFIPGIVALVYAAISTLRIWHINEHSNVTADGPPVYHSRPSSDRGRADLLQGVAEIVRCIVCLKTGEWPSRLHDVAEIDVVGSSSPTANSWTAIAQDRHRRRGADR
jgi:TRAP-type mannitol/chloroaromatic compound transport system permease small subunit